MFSKWPARKLFRHFGVTFVGVTCIFLSAKKYTKYFRLCVEEEKSERLNFKDLS